MQIRNHNHSLHISILFSESAKSDPLEYFVFVKKKKKQLILKWNEKCIYTEITEMDVLRRRT